MVNDYTYHQWEGLVNELIAVRSELYDSLHRTISLEDRSIIESALGESLSPDEWRGLEETC